MTDGTRLRQLLLNIQHKLTRLGSNNRARWEAFSPDTQMSQSQFISRLSIFGINIPPQDAATLWRATNILSETMQFSDFIKFLQAESFSIPSDYSVSSPSQSNFSLLESMRDNIPTLVSKFLEMDPLTSGTITHRAFSEVCSWFANSDDQIPIRKLLAKYDPQNTGNFPYFYFLGDLCSANNRSIDFNMSNQRVPQSPYSEVSQRSPGASYSQYAPPPLDSFSPGNRQNYSPRQPNSPSFSPRDTNNYLSTPKKTDACDKLKSSLSHSSINFYQNSPSAPSQNDYYKEGRRTASGGRGRLDPTIFHECNSSPKIYGTSSGGRGRLDPSIFGHPPQAESMPEQPIKHADDYVNAERVEGLTPNQLIELISKQVSRVSRGSRQCYAKWRGSTHDYLDANDLRDGLARDANILVPLRDLQLVIRQYGGPMTMSSFVRMLGDGGKFAESNSSIDGMKKATEDEAALIRIADQVIGTQWENMVIKSPRTEDIVKGFESMGVYTNEEDIQRLTSKLGKIGFVDAIKARIQ